MERLSWILSQPNVITRVLKGGRGRREEESLWKNGLRRDSADFEHTERKGP